MSNQYKPVCFATNNRYDEKTGCWNWTGAIHANGYGIIRYAGKAHRVHRVCAHIYLGFDLSSRLDVCHKCDNRRCFNPRHLFIGTRKDNMQDAKSKGRIVLPDTRGECHPQAKLNNSDVLEIRHSMTSAKELSKLYGVTPVSIMNIKRFKTWRHI